MPLRFPPSRTGHAADPIFAAIEVHRKAAAVEQAAWAEVNRLHELADEKISPSVERALTDGPCKEAWDALEQFAATVPTTLPGLRAMIVYANELEAEDREAFSESDLLESLAAAVRTLVQS